MSPIPLLSLSLLMQVPVENEGEKPEFSDLDSDVEDTLEVENWDEWGGIDGDQEEDAKDDEPEESEETQPSTSKAATERELVAASRYGGKRQRKSKFAELLEKKRPVFNPEDHKTFERYLDEYYKLDYEDIVGDMPCRFKYRSVPMNDYGLDTAEVLSAPDRELNAWCSLKKTCQYR
jgi:protein KRI1